MQRINVQGKPSYKVDSKVDLASSIFFSYQNMMEALKESDTKKFYNIVLGLDALINPIKDDQCEKEITELIKDISAKKHKSYQIEKVTKNKSPIDYNFVYALEHLKIIQSVLSRRSMFPNKELMENDDDPVFDISGEQSPVSEEEF